MDKENKVHELQYFLVVREWNLVICGTMNKCGGHYIKWNKPY